MTVDKPSVFQFAANIRIKLQDDVTENAQQGEDVSGSYSIVEMVTNMLSGIVLLCIFP